MASPKATARPEPALTLRDALRGSPWRVPAIVGVVSAAIGGVWVFSTGQPIGASILAGIVIAVAPMGWTYEVLRRRILRRRQ